MKEMEYLHRYKGIRIITKYGYFVSMRKVKIWVGNKQEGSNFKLFFICQGLDSNV